MPPGQGKSRGAKRRRKQQRHNARHNAWTEEVAATEAAEEVVAVCEAPTAKATLSADAAAAEGAGAASMAHQAAVGEFAKLDKTALEQHIETLLVSVEQAETRANAAEATAAEAGIKLKRAEARANAAEAQAAEMRVQLHGVDVINVDTAETHLVVRDDVEPAHKRLKKMETKRQVSVKAHHNIVKVKQEVIALQSINVKHWEPGAGEHDQMQIIPPDFTATLQKRQAVQDKSRKHKEGDQGDQKKSCAPVFDMCQQLQQAGNPINQALDEHAEVFVVSHDDPRVGLRGQKGLRAAKPLKQGMAFMVTSRVLLIEDYMAALVRPADFIQHERYSFGFKTGENWNVGPLIADLASHGNKVLYVNDSMGSGAEPNLEFSEFVRDGWPYLFVVVAKDVELGRELLIDYGTAYWDSVGALKRERMLKMQADLQNVLGLVTQCCEPTFESLTR